MTWSAKGTPLSRTSGPGRCGNLLSAVPDRGVHNAIDLGCGPGNSTQVLRHVFRAQRCAA